MEHKNIQPAVHYTVGSASVQALLAGLSSCIHFHPTSTADRESESRAQSEFARFFFLMATVHVTSVRDILIPANSNTNQYSYPNSDGEYGKRAVFGLSRNPTQSIIADPGTNFDCLIPQAGRLIERCALATTETIYDVLQDGQDRFGDLVARGRGAPGCTSFGASSNSAEFLFNCAQVTSDGGDAGIKLNCTMLKHQLSPCAGVVFSSASLSGGISGTLRPELDLGTGRCYFRFLLFQLFVHAGF
jgi:hypothetical protein